MTGRKVDGKEIAPGWLWRTHAAGIGLYVWQWYALWEEADRADVSVSSIIRECLCHHFNPPAEEGT